MAPKLPSWGISAGLDINGHLIADRKGVMGAMRASGGDYPERLGRPVCQYYMKTGMCKFGVSCKYHHPSQGGGSSMPTALNIYGYPLRPGEKECSYYVKTGHCKFGVICIFHHPQPAGVLLGAPVPGPGFRPMPVLAAGICPTVQPNQQHGVPCGYWPVAWPTMLTGSYVPSTYCPMLLPQGLVYVPGWTPYHASVSPAASTSTQPHVRASPVFGVTQLSPQAPPHTGQYVPVSSFTAPSGSSPMSDYFADLPQELISDILIRLPLKSIGRSRCVSKLWLSLLTSYEFIKAHLDHHTHFAQDEKLLLLSPSSLFSSTLHPGGNHLRRLEFLNERVSFLLGSCNGLVLVMAKYPDKWLINCTTEEYVKLPASPLASCPHARISKYGFGYDSLRDDYKIVKISQCGNHNAAGGIACGDNMVDIYSLKMRCWKRFGTCPYDLHCSSSASCVFFNGAIHRIGSKSSYKKSVVIVAFDLSDEKFAEIPVPASVDLIVLGEVRVIDGCLGIVVHQYHAGLTEIWLMKSYSLVESWTKLVIDSNHYIPLCFPQDKILFHDRCARDLKWYCLKDGRVCSVGDGGRYFMEGITYSESLVSPHFKSQN